ncbi:hypothetical protein VAWG001_15480 [Aeromonas dhakensis]|nr:hypothetical protein VAWG001_15480 [Aeromonas dhakensis]
MLGADLFAFAAADAIFIAIDEVFHAAVLFGPVMDSGRTDIYAVTAVDAFVVGKHHLKLAAEPFRVGAPGAAKVAALEKNQRANAIAVIYRIFLDIEYAAG